jgi:hypothetical protein
MLARAVFRAEKFCVFLAEFLPQKNGRNPARHSRNPNLPAPMRDAKEE